MACCSWRFVNIEAVVSDVYFNQSDINLNMTAAINRLVFLFSDQAGYILDIHKASVLPYKVFLYLNAANVFADIIGREIAFHSGNKGDNCIKKDICICSDAAV